MDYNQGVGGYPQSGFSSDSGRKSHKGLLIFLFTAVFVVSVLIVIVLLGGFSAKSVSEKQLSQGASVSGVKENNTVKLNFGNEQHSINVDFVGLNSVNLTIQSEPIKVTLKLNEVKEIDLDGDGIADLRVKLVSIDNGKATLAVMKISKQVCQENWQCSGWSACSSGKQTRVCTDSNSCGTIDSKPSEEKTCLEVQFFEDNNTPDNNTPTNETVNNTINETMNDSSVLNDSANNTLNDFLGQPFYEFSCNKNIDLFISFANSCVKDSNITCETSADLFGMGAVQNTSIYYELEGFNESRCTFYLSYENISVYYTPDLIQSSLDAGSTQDEINQQLQSTNQDYQTLIGKNSTCYYPIPDLVNMILGWKSGNISYSSEDEQKYNCTGSLYEYNVVQTTY